LIAKYLGCTHLPTIRINVFVGAVARVRIAVEATSGIGIRRHRINAQESSTQRAFVVGEPIFPSPFKNLAQVFAGGLCVNSSLDAILARAHARGKLFLCLFVNELALATFSRWGWGCVGFA
jgi:hypothetical protein